MSRITLTEATSVIFGSPKTGRPFAEGEVGGDDDRDALVEPAHEVEEQLPAGLREGQVSEFVEDAPHRRLLVDARLASHHTAQDATRWSEFATLRRSLLQIGTRVVEKAGRVRIHFASACPETALFRLLAGRLATPGP